MRGGRAPPLQLVHVKPGPSYVAELSAEIERVDVHLSNFKRWQASSVTGLVEQERQLEVRPSSSPLASIVGVCARR